MIGGHFLEGIAALTAPFWKRALPAPVVQPEAPAAAPELPREVLAAIVDASLERRRIGRAERQEAARRREADKHHEAFERDALILATRRTITNGGK